MILKNLISNIYYISPEILIIIGIFISTIYGVILKNNVRVIGSLIILTFAGSIFQIININCGKILLFEGSIVISKFIQFSKIIILLCNSIIILIIANFGYKATNINSKLSFEIPIMIALSTLGMCVLASSNSLLTFYLGLELFSLSLYILIATNRNDSKSIEASLKYFILGSISSGIYLFGASLIYGNAGTINFDEISLVYQTNCYANFCLKDQNLLFITDFILIIITIMFKLSLFPFHNWTPDVYEGAQSSIVVLLASSAKFSVLVIFLRLIFEPLMVIKDQLQPIFIVISICSMLFGNILAIVQSNIKRLLGYSAIGNMGFMLMSIVVYDRSFLHNTIFYSIVYMTQILTFFALIIILKRKISFNNNLNDLRGLSKNNSFICFSLAIIAFSMAGIPPLIGFFAKLYIFITLINFKMYYLAIIAIIATVIGSFYCINIIRKMYFDKVINGSIAKKIKLNLVEIIIISLGLGFNIFYVLFPSYMLKIINNYI